MLTKLNYTGRIDLPVECVKAEIQVDEARFTLRLSWDFEEFHFDPKCSVMLDLRAAGTTDTRRYTLGHLGSGRGEKVLDISSMRNPLTSRLRIKVVSGSKEFRVLEAQLDNFRPMVPLQQEDSKSILKIYKDPGLDVPWRVKIDSGEPILVISGKDEIYSLLNNEDSIFMPAVMAEVVRQIFVWRAKDREEENAELSSAWRAFFIELGCDESFFEDSDEPFSDIEREQSIADESESIAVTFSIRHKLIRDIRSRAEIGESE